MTTPNPPPSEEELRREFKRLKDLRNNRHIGEPEFDDSVIQLITRSRQQLIDELEGEGPGKCRPGPEALDYWQQGYNDAVLDWRALIARKRKELNDV